MNKFNLAVGLSFGVMATTIVVVPTALAVTEHNRSSMGDVIYEDAIEEIKQICTIPHVSNEEPPVKYDETDDNLFQIRNYLIQKINEYMDGDAAIVDDARNVYFDIPASKGAENYEGIALQAHMDMVWDAQGEAKQWDKKTHPVSQPVIEEVDGNLVMHSDKWLTSLGADDAQGMGMILSLAKNRNKFKHGLIRCVITADEETTGHGADNLGIINGQPTDMFKDVPYIVTLDTPHGGKVITTAAGIDAENLDINEITLDPTTKQYETKITLSNFLGGHSGEEIDLGRSSPIQLAAGILEQLITKDGKEIELGHFSTTSEAMNQIPTDAEVVFYSDDDCSELCEEYINTIKTELKVRGVEKKATLEYSSKPKVGDALALSSAQTNALIKFVDAIPFGVVDRFEDDWFVGSSANICPFSWKINDNKLNIHMNVSVRFGSMEWYDPLIESINDEVDQLKETFTNLTFEQITWYPVWEFKQDNKLCDLCIQAHKSVGVEAQTMKSHGGLETAHITTDYPELSAIAIGATDLNEHKVTEQLFIHEYENLANILLYMIQNISK